MGNAKNKVLITALAKAMWEGGTEVKRGLVPPWDKILKNEQMEFSQYAKDAIGELEKHFDLVPISE